MPPQSSGCRPSAASSLFTRSTFASGMSILLMATTIGTSAARAWEIDSFVCGMTPSSAATTSTAMSVTFAPRARIAVNASWPGVSRNVILRPSDVRLVRADVLRDAAGLGLHDGCLADRVEQRRLAVVDVAHDRHDRRTRDEILLGVLELRRLELLVGRVLDRDLALDLGGDHLDLLVGERLGRGPHLAEVHQDLDELGHRDAERLREVLDRDAGLDGDGTGRRWRRRLLARRRRCVRSRGWRPSRPRAPPPSMTTRRLRPPGPAAGADRAIRPVSSVSHQCGQLSSSSSADSASGRLRDRRVLERLVLGELGVAVRPRLRRGSGLGLGLRRPAVRASAWWAGTPQ